MSGNNTIVPPGQNGTPAANVPGARIASVSWADSSGNLWLFGGVGYDSAGLDGELNDLWEYIPTNPFREWTWIGGSKTANAVGVYGTLGLAAADNMPGGRQNAASWIDSAENLWLFGGDGNDGTGKEGFLNDLWKFNLTSKEWTWVSGSNSVGANSSGQTGVYGTEGVAAASNVPGSRYQTSSWIDISGNLWLFGGEGIDANGKYGTLNDLWEFNTSKSEWVWMGGSDKMTCGADGFCSQPGVYGTQGVASATNVPGSRFAATSWTDMNGNFWLFGGGDYGYLNDLWEFNPTTKEWKWVSGSNTAGSNGGAESQSGVYGTKGIAAVSNVPGGRFSSVGWIDNGGNLWLFGGQSASPNSVYFNDLWKFNPNTSEWTWISGSSTAGASGVYGTQGVAGTGNVPGAREGAVGWTDDSGDLWLFGGAFNGYYNDLWRYQP